LIANSVSHGFKDSNDIDIEISLSVIGSELHISVCDSGIGMDADAQKQIFDPFYTTDRGHCSGLGLHIVYNKVYQLFHGSLEVFSEPGQGPRVALNLPLLS
jgi:signal transduction histidine kinase